jgi:hypothetical protein
LWITLLVKFMIYGLFHLSHYEGYCFFERKWRILFLCCNRRSSYLFVYWC